MSGCLSHCKQELKCLDSMKITEQKVQPDIHFPLSAVHLFSTRHISPLSATPLLPCALHRLHPPLPPYFFVFLAPAERWSLGSHVSVSPPSCLQIPLTVVVLLQISAGRLWREQDRQTERNRLLPPQTILTSPSPPLLLSPLQIFTGRP